MKNNEPRDQCSSPTSPTPPKRDLTWSALAKVKATRGTRSQHVSGSCYIYISTSKLTIPLVMLAESALALALPPPKGTSLPPIGIRGGVLTPSAAMGMVLVERLQKSGTVLFESRLVGKPKRS